MVELKSVKGKHTQRNWCFKRKAPLIGSYFVALLILTPYLVTFDLLIKSDASESSEKAEIISEVVTEIPSNPFGVTLSSDQDFLPEGPCYEGEIMYMKNYPNIVEEIISGYAHWNNGGLTVELRTYSCNPEPSANAYSESACGEGEIVYRTWYPDVAAVIPEAFETAFQHWVSRGKQEGRVYFCKWV